MESIDEAELAIQTIVTFTCACGCTKSSTKTNRRSEISVKAFTLKYSNKHVYALKRRLILLYIS